MELGTRLVHSCHSKLLDGTLLAIILPLPFLVIKQTHLVCGKVAHNCQ